MGKYAAQIEIGWKYVAQSEIGWINKWFEGDDPCGVIREVERIQDFDCLLDMGRMEEGKKGQKELDKLEAFLMKYHDGSLTMQDIKDLDIRLRLGPITCHGIKEP